MPNRIRNRKCLLLLACWLLWTALAAPAQENGIRWFKDLAQGKEEALKTNRPLLIDFWADWCGPCKIMDAEVYTNPAVVAAVSNKVIAVRLNFDMQQDLVRQYNAEALPYLVFANSYGAELMHHRGLLEAEDLTAVVRALPADLSEINRLYRILQEDKNHSASLREMSRQLRAVGFFQSSNSFLERALKQDEAKNDPAQKEAIYFDMGLNSLELEDGKQAAASFEKCLKEFPQSLRRVDILLSLGRAYTLAGAPEKAKATLDRLIAEYPEKATQARQILQTLQP